LSTERIRLFVAARIPEGHLDQLDDQVAGLRSKLTNARWTTPENQHLTLKFLGSTPVDHLDAVCRTCEMVASGHAPAELRLTDLGAFPTRSRVRVLWVGVDDSSNVLQAVAKDLDRAYESIGFASEGRDYSPHLTVARFKLPVPLKSGFPSIDTSGIGPFSFDELTLFRSHLSPKGARYEVVKTFPLGSRP
jgi:2'-5' RNA ligase